tara:strand:+ start:526 stop:630 length:105 start_codon:yes stop_codon:yes gene_type:complete
MVKMFAPEKLVEIAAPDISRTGVSRQMIAAQAVP